MWIDALIRRRSAARASRPLGLPDGRGLLVLFVTTAQLDGRVAPSLALVLAASSTLQRGTAVRRRPSATHTARSAHAAQGARAATST